MAHDPYNARSFKPGEDEEDDFYASGNVRDGDFEEKAPGVGPGDNSGDEDLSELELDDLMKQGRRILFEDLYKAVKGGYASPQEKNTFRQLLKDNGMIAGDPFDDEPAEGGQRNSRPSRAPLPSYGPPEYDT